MRAQHHIHGGLTFGLIPAAIANDLTCNSNVQDDQQFLRIQDSLLNSFFAWVKTKVELKLVEFTIKGSEQQPYITA